MVDDRLARVARRAGALEVALQPAGDRDRRTGSDARGGRLPRPRLARAAEEPALAVVDLHRPQRLELLGALDALGDDPRADLAGERGGGAQHGLAGASRSTPATMPRESLRKSGRMSATYSKRGEARARVVDRDQRAARDPRPQPLAQQRVVEHRVLLGELDHEPRRQLARQLEQPGMPERLGREVDPQQATVGRDAGGGDRPPARDLEVVAQARARAAAASVTSGGSATRPGGVGKRARPS